VASKGISQRVEQAVQWLCTLADASGRPSAAAGATRPSLPDRTETAAGWLARLAGPEGLIVAFEATIIVKVSDILKDHSHVY